MSARLPLFGLVAAALLAPGLAIAQEKPVGAPPASAPAAPMGVLKPTDGKLPPQRAQDDRRPAARRLSPSQLYALEHKRPPSFATVRPQMRKPAPGEGPDDPRNADKPAADKLPAQAGVASAAGAAAKPTLDAFLADRTPPKKATRPAATAKADGDAGKPSDAKPATATTKVVKKTTRSTTATASLAPSTQPGVTEIVVRPATPAQLYERAAVQYRDLRRRDLELVRHLLPPSQYEAKLAAIEAAWRQ